jgi:hypothetical protein
VLLVAGAATLATFMPRMWTEFGYRVGRRSYERELLNFAAAPGTLAYGEGSASTTIAADTAGSWIQPISLFQARSALRGGRSRNAPGWQSWFSFLDYSLNVETTLFLHERVSPNGARPLVAVACLTSDLPWTPQSRTERFAFRVAVATPATMLTSSSVRATAQSTWMNLGKWPDVKTPVRFFVGQPDPADPSRFTIDYAFGDATGTLVGQLHDDGTVSLVAKDGPLAGQ